MKSLSLLVLALAVACSSTDPAALLSPESPSSTAPTALSFDRATVDVKLSTTRKGAQWKAPKLTFTRGAAVDPVVITLAPTVACAGAGGVRVWVDPVRVAGDTTFSVPMSLCFGPSGIYTTGSVTLSAAAIVGTDTLRATTTVVVR
jgi:hypothetical protein